MEHTALTRSQINSRLPEFAGGLGKTNKAKLTALAEILDGELPLQRALNHLYPDQPLSQAEPNFRKMRQLVNDVAKAQGSDFRLQTDGNTRSPLEEKYCMAVDISRTESEQQVTRVNRDASQNIAGYNENQFIEPKGSSSDIRFFVVWAEKDRDLVDELLQKLKPYLRNPNSKRNYIIWQSTQITSGTQWRQEIDNSLKECHYGLLMVSPNMLDSDFVQKYELPQFVGSAKEHTKPFVPVSLCQVGKGAEMHGLQDYQFFRWRNTRNTLKSWEELKDSAHKGNFADLLFQSIEQRIDLAEQQTHRMPENKPRIKEDIEQEHQSELKKTNEIQEVDYFTSSLGTRINTEGKPIDDKVIDALSYVGKWAKMQSLETPFFALLGDYGIGKSTLCRQLARQLQLEYDDKSFPWVPLLIDLKDYSDFQSSHSIEDVLAICLRSQITSNDRRAGVIKEILALAEQKRLLVIFDGLDEVLVRITPDQSHGFLNTIFSLVQTTLGDHEQAKTETKAKGTTKIQAEKPLAKKFNKLLVSCRSHYFRSNFDQKNYLASPRSGKNDSNILTLELLPFNEEQIREYLLKRFGSEQSLAMYQQFAAIHNLLDLSSRPMLLDLLSDLVASGGLNELSQQQIGVSELYRVLANHSLSRDIGKHSIGNMDKLDIMANMAGVLALRGKRSWSVDTMEQWINGYFNDTGLHLTYSNQDRAIIHEDIRGASFLVRSGEEFRFSHTSFFEYFLARKLLSGAGTPALEGWQIAHPGKEVLSFIAEMSGDIEQQHILNYLAQARDTVEDRAKQTLALHWWLETNAHLVPELKLSGLNLDEIEFVGKEQQLLNLAGSEFNQCSLFGTEWKFVNCHSARFHRCDFRGSHWQLVQTEEAKFIDCQTERMRSRRVRPQHAGFANQTTEARPHIDSKQAQLLFSQGHSSLVTSCAFSPDGSMIVSASHDNTVKLWDLKYSRCIESFTGHSDWVRSCAFSPDGSMIVSASDDKTVKLWDLKSSRCIETFTGHSAYVTSCAFSPDGSMIVSASSDKTVKLWDLKSSRCIESFTGHSGGVTSCAFSPDGRMIVSASSDKTVKLWDLKSSRCIETFTGHSGYVTSCAFSPDGSMIVSASDDKTVKLWDLKSSRCIETFTGHSGYVRSCAFSPDGSMIVSASDDKTVKLWDLKSSRCIETFTGHSGYVRSCAFSPDGSMIVSASDDKTVKLWDLKSSRCIETFTGHSDLIRSCAFSPDGRMIVSASDDKTVKLWDLQSSRCIESFTGHSDWVNSCAFSPDGSMIVSASYDKTMKLWDLKSSRCIETFTGHSGYVRSCAFSPDGSMIVSASDDKTVKLWDLKSSRCIENFTGHSGGVNSCAFSPDGSMIVSASDDNTVKLWDLKSSRCIENFTGHSDWVRSCAFSPDGSMIVSASDDNTVKLWDLKSSRCIESFTGHSGGVRSCAFSPDGSMIVSASDDNTVKLWDLKSSRCIENFTGHSDWVRSCAFSPDGSMIVSASDDGSTCLWHITGHITGQTPEHILERTPGRIDETKRTKKMDGEETQTTPIKRWQQYGDNEYIALNNDSTLLHASDEAWRHIGWRTKDGTVLDAETFDPVPDSMPLLP